jgi:serine/threonine-protein kinase
LTVYVRVLRDALDGLDYAHRLTDFDGRPLGIVHRDISPQNVLVTYAGHGKVLDFGIAKVTDSPLTEAGIIKGKAGYIAPEQVAGVSVDGRADVFAVGVMLWEGIANRRMVDRKLEDVAILTRRAEGAEPRIREVVPDAPSALADICDRALATSPRDRFASAAEMRDALEAWLRTREDAAEPRTIAALLETHFADDRTRIRKLIEQQISKTEAGGAILDVRPLSSLTPPARSRDPVKRDDALPDDVETVVPTASQARLARASREEVTRRFDTRRWTVLAAAAAVVVGGAALVGSRAVASRSAGRDRGTVEPIQRGAEPPASPGAAAAAAAAPRMVSVKIETTPRDAKVLLDGRPLGDAGGTGRLVADEVAHELRVEADGYAPKSRSVSLSADLNVIIHLEKAPRAPVVKGASEGVSPKQPPATSANAPSTGTPSGAASGGRGRLDWKDPWVN